MMDLGPYSDFIWPAYAVSALALLVTIAQSLAAWRAAKKKIAALGK